MTPATTEECLDFLKEAKDALENLQLLKAQEKELVEKEALLERAYESEKKRVHDTAQQTVCERRNEIHDNYDREIAKLQEQLKKVRSKREKTKNQGMKERIADETSVLYRDIQNCMAQLKHVVKQNHMPFYCGTKLYYSLYFPRHFREFVTFLMFIALFFVVLPCGAYLCIPQRRPFYLAIVYVLDLFICGGIYLVIGNKSRDHYSEPLKVCRGLLDQVYHKKKTIRRTIKAIQRDRDEGRYNLGEFDDEISRLQQELDEVAVQKKDALNAFESVTKNIIVDEIEENNRPRLEQLSGEHEQAGMGLKAVRQDLKNRNLSFTDHYGSYLGKEFMDPVKVARLCLIVQDGKASNVSEAIERYREGEIKG